MMATINFEIRINLTEKKLLLPINRNMSGVQRPANIGLRLSRHSASVTGRKYDAKRIAD
jgi:hypothetical protein